MRLFEKNPWSMVTQPTPIFIKICQKSPKVRAAMRERFAASGACYDSGALMAWLCIIDQSWEDGWKLMKSHLPKLPELIYYAEYAKRGDLNTLFCRLAETIFQWNVSKDLEEPGWVSAGFDIAEFAGDNSHYGNEVCGNWKQMVKHSLGNCDFCGKPLDRYAYRLTNGQAGHGSCIARYLNEQVVALIADHHPILRNSPSFMGKVTEAVATLDRRYLTDIKEVNKAATVLEQEHPEWADLREQNQTS